MEFSGISVKIDTFSIVGIKQNPQKKAIKPLEDIPGTAL